jgi:hypothetical protein
MLELWETGDLPKSFGNDKGLRLHMARFYIVVAVSLLCFVTPNLAQDLSSALREAITDLNEQKYQEAPPAG